MALASLIIAGSALAAPPDRATYARRCSSELSPLPRFNCQDGVRLSVPSSHTGPDCPNLRSASCWTNQQWLVDVPTGDPDVTAYAICRKYDHQSPTDTYQDIAMIQHHRLSGATCWFQSPPGSDVSGVDVPSPTDPDASNVWLTPSSTAVHDCQGCHAADPYLLSPYIEKAVGTNPRGWNPNGPYEPDFQDIFSSPVRKTFSMPDGPCAGCHRFSTSILLDTVVDAESMPPQTPGNGQSWHQRFGPEVERIKTCIAEGWEGVCGQLELAGVWNTNFGRLSLRQIGSYVVGDYASHGLIAGKREGSCVTGTFTNGVNGRPGHFKFVADGPDAFEGQWAMFGQAIDSRAWTGQRTSSMPATSFSNFRSPQDGPLRSIDNSRSDFDGRFDSTYGAIELYSRDLLMVGDYGPEGTLIGIWDGNGFVGQFVNSSGFTGWFDFSFYSLTANFRSGEWGYQHGQRIGSWTLNRRTRGTVDIDNLSGPFSCP